MNEDVEFYWKRKESEDESEGMTDYGSELRWRG